MKLVERSVLRVTLFLIIALLLVSTTPQLAAQGLEAWALYDDFNTQLIDPDKWTGFEFGTQKNTTREAVREIRRRSLRLAHAIYGDPLLPGFRQDGGTRLHFADSPTVTALEATVRIDTFQVTDCRPANPTLSHVSVHIDGFFFNAEPGGPPIPGDHTNDVAARISISRDSDSTDPPGVLQVKAMVFIPVPGAPIAGALPADIDLGTVRRGQRVRLRIQWDPDNDQFIFQRDDEPEELAPYSVSDTAPPGRDSKFLDLTNLAANCLTSPVPIAYMEAYFDNVFVNASAAP